MHSDPGGQAAGGAELDSRDKHDGYRLIVRKRDGRVQLFARRGYDWTDRYPLIRAAIAGLRTTSATIDGEAVCCDDAGMAVFEKLPYRGPPVTLRHIRSHGVRHLLIHCSTGLCHHSAVISADGWPDDTVLLDLDRRAVCTTCGMIGVDVRPNWNERPKPESLTGAQWPLI